MGSNVKNNVRDAAAAGDRLYFTGLMCRRGHVAPRYTINSDCLECNRERAKANMQTRRESLRDLLKADKSTPDAPRKP